jgi:glycine/D-amino acid oxidase-like deaminating enzyme
MVSQQRDLHGGKPVWAAGSPFPGRAPPPHSQADVVIVGAGFTGAVIAETLTAAGLSVALVDRRGPARGSTAASTALLLFEIDVPLIKLAEKIGQERAARVWTRTASAMRQLDGKVAALGIDCDFAERQSLYLAGNVLDADGLAAEADARRKIGIASEWLDRRALRSTYAIDRPAALLSGNSAEADPVRLTHGLLGHALARGAKLYFPADVTAVESTGDGVVAVLDGSARITARHLVFSTGYELPKWVPQTGMRIISTWAMATPPQRTLWHSRCLIWEAADPYLYLRTTPDGRILIGGEDEECESADYREAVLGEKTKALQDKLRALLDVDATAAFAWTGAFGKSDTGLPKIGAINARPGSYAVLGFGGNGMTYAMIAADIIKGLISGQPDPDADLFAFA